MMRSIWWVVTACVAGCGAGFLGGGGSSAPPVEQHPDFLEAVQGFEVSQTIAATDPTEAKIDEARAAAERCVRGVRGLYESIDRPFHRTYSDATLDATVAKTSAGPIALPEIRTRCEATQKSFDDVTVHRCGYKRVTITQLNLGGDRWSDPKVEACHPARWMVRTCNDKPAADKKWDPSPVGFAAIRDACKARWVVYTGSSWKTQALDGGQIERSIQAECWTEEDVAFGAKGWSKGWVGVCADLFR